MNTAVRRIAVTGAAAALMSTQAIVPAQAEGSPFIALVYSAVEGVVGGGTGATADAAVASAMVGCRDVNLGTACDIIHVNDANTDAPCLAIVQGATPAQWAFGEGATPAAAEADALRLVPGASVLGSGCATPGEVAPAPDEATPAVPTSATVTSDVDIYLVPDGVGIPLPGVFLNAGDSFALVEPCRDNWCHLAIPFVPGGTGWVYQDGFLDVS